MSLRDKLKGRKNPSKIEPLWKGPEVDGVTQSMLSKFLVCRERFRVYAIEGLRQQEGFNARIEYGNMWHICEETHLTGDWEAPLKTYAKVLCQTYPLQQEEVNKWYNVCRIHFPIYLDYWSKHQDTIQLEPLLQEEVFHIPYILPSGRTVYLRGKWDSVDRIKSGVNKGVWLQENKTKSEIDGTKLERQLTFDLQSMFYSVALSEYMEGYVGIRYNVIRRPLSGGKGTIKQHQPSKSKPQGESLEEYYDRLRCVLEEYPEEYFARWNIRIQSQDIEKFKRETLNPVLEQLCDWYQHIVNCCNENSDPFTTELYWVDSQKTMIHWRHPYGIYNPMNEGGFSDLDEYLTSGNKVGLTRVDTLFRELE